ncbi:hypothetical protein F4553_001651 [Allocatelliglobosispora scoriae]|uniref:TIR domain-containing protein n=1 Tax=Allocatelliglobosispora scoriae TaxID=643052 RepID=A0A841BNF2_9ACTN|nr:toll/interleukin-1 receptor domain-containing protein [Allocatelliglobosispora scoriae]MBB5868272.1 hypothetical protein [Allocatelliglobosispora scoriae]
MRVFLAYSRQQFSAAEQLAAILTAQGIDVWFDAERLVPGMDWAHLIEEAITSADAMVLLASSDSLNSPHVHQELLGAIEAQVPVHAAVVEACDLPGGLAGVVDLRRRFEKRAATFGRNLLGGKPIPRASSRGIRYPVPILVILAALTVNLLAIVGNLVLYPIDLAIEEVSWDHMQWWEAARGVAAPAVAIALAAYAGVIRHRFRRRRVRFGLLLAALLTGLSVYQLAGGLINAVVEAADHGSLDRNLRLTDATSRGDVYFALASLLLILMNLAAVGCLCFSRSVFRWIPAGEAPGWLRRRALRPAGNPRPPTTRVRRSQRIAVYHAIGDTPVAEEVTKAFAPVWSVHAKGEPDLRVVVISGATSWEWARGLLRSGPSVAVLVGSVRPPADADELQLVQWLDFRDGDTERLRSRAAVLRSSAAPVQSSPPRAIDRFAAPTPVRFLVAFMIAMGAVLGSSAILSVSVVAPESMWRNIQHGVMPTVPNPADRRYNVANPNYVHETAADADQLLRIRAGLAAVLCPLLLWGARRLGARRITLTGLSTLVLFSAIVTGTWLLLGWRSEEPGSGLLLFESLLAAGVFVYGIGSAPRLAAWLPDQWPRRRAGQLPAVAPTLLRFSVPLAFGALTALYISGTIL